MNELPVRKSEHLSRELEYIPYSLKQIPEPPVRLNIRGYLPCLKRPYPQNTKDFKPNSDFPKLITIVGTRTPTHYGREVCEKIVRDLRGYPIIIVSGLALGIDSIALETAIDVGIPCIAFPGSGLDDDVIYPPNKNWLAQKILESNGALISEFKNNAKSERWMFPQRNRLMTGISDVTVIIEAKEKSGSLITAKYAVDYNKELMVVPGSIFSELSKGTHQFLKLGAHPLTSTNDLLEILGLESLTEKTISELSDEEKNVLIKISGSIDKDELFDNLDMPVTTAGSIIMSLILKGILKEVGNELICAKDSKIC